MSDNIQSRLLARESVEPYTSFSINAQIRSQVWRPVVVAVEVGRMARSAADEWVCK